MTKVSKRENIKFNFHPYLWTDKKHVVEKEDSTGVKRRYLIGIASGLKRDGQNERMTKGCIEKMQKLANSGDLMIFDCPHGVAGTDDIGIIVRSEITPLGEWLIEARLYDEKDGFASNSVTLEKVDKLWRQVNGLPPYSVPKQKGFSVEGYVPEGGIVSMSDTGGNRVINDIELDGVIVTPRPAYSDSIASAIYKTLDELMPEKKEELEENIFLKLTDKLKSGEYGHNFYLNYYSAQDAMQDILEEYLRHPRQLDDRLNAAFEQYKRVMIELLKRNIGLFRNKSAAEYAVQKDNRMRTLFLKVSEQLLIHKTRNKRSINNARNK